MMMIPLPRKWLLTAGAMLAVVLATFSAGWKVRGWQADADLAEVRRGHSDAVARAEAENSRLQAQYRDRERQLQDQITGVSDELSRQLQDVEMQYTAALELATSDAGRLRIEVARCRAASVPSAPESPLAPVGNDAAAPERVIPEPNPAMDLLAIGRDADRVAARLRACQSYVQQIHQ